MRLQVPETDGRYPVRTGVHPHFTARVDAESGEYVLPDDHPQFEEVRETLTEELGHTPVGEEEGGSETQSVDFSRLTEEQVVGMEYREMQELAGDVDGVKGNAPEGELEEALILEVREAQE